MLALAAAGVAAFVPGFLHVEVGAVVRAGGALGVFAVVFFFNPAGWIAESGPGEVVLHDWQRECDNLINEISGKVSPQFAVGAQGEATRLLAKLNGVEPGQLRGPGEVPVLSFYKAAMYYDLAYLLQARREAEGDASMRGTLTKDMLDNASLAQTAASRGENEYWSIRKGGSVGANWSSDSYMTAKEDLKKEKVLHDLEWYGLAAECLIAHESPSTGHSGADVKKQANAFFAANPSYSDYGDINLLWAKQAH